MLQPLKCGLFVSLVKNGIALSLTLSFGISTRLFISPCSVVVFFELRSRLIAPKKERYISVKLFIRRHGFVSENCADICWLQQLHQLTSYFWEPQKNASKTLLSIVRGGWEEGLSWPDFVYFTFGIGKIDSVLPIRSFPFHH